ncbi:MAG: IS66 family insertion sequence element accessory protein TnpB [Planctomycetes bacterium]|nr:IS66 family insertion sequence element accessory protein TnpB [Planctomycetota bacterium]
MLSLSHCQRIFLARAPADMRKGANGLAALVRDQLDRDPLSGDAFVFISRHRSSVKILAWDVSGYWLASKRLERGTFAVAGRLGSRDARGSHALSVAEIMAILEGIEVRAASYHQHYTHPPTRLNASMAPAGGIGVGAAESPR